MSAAGLTARARRRALRRGRRRRAVLVLLAPAAWIIATDVGRRGAHLWTFDALHVWAYLGTAAASLVLWAALLYAASPRDRLLSQAAAGLFVTLFTLATGVESAHHALFGIYFSHDGQIYSRSVAGSLLGFLPLARPVVAWRMAVALALALGLVCAARRSLRPGRRTRRVAPLCAPLALAAATQLPASFRMWQSSTPDVIYLHGLVSFAKERLRLRNDAPELRVQRRRPERVPPLAARPARPRNVLFVLQESLRYDVSCNAFDPAGRCATPFSNHAAPGRIPLEQMRSASSTSAIAIAHLWSGVPATGSMDEVHSVPLLWEYAAAAGYEASYLTAQNVMFGSMRLYVQDLPVAHLAVATHLDSRAAYDEGASDAALTDWVARVWPELGEPFFAVVHYSNVHFPYVYDPAHAPFQPSEFSRDPDKHEAYFNYYKNVVHLSDMAVGRLLHHVRSTDKGRRTVIVYTSDHGESFREHWQLGHTSSLYDEEIHMPAWIDAPAGTLAPEEEAALVAARHELVWHYDLTATMLDLMGVWDAPELAPFRARMVGRPITRKLRTARPVPLTNCSWLWECGFRNWGLMQGRRKLIAREWDEAYHCFDVVADPMEQVDLGERACAPLAELARLHFGAMPVDPWPQGKDLLWGPMPEAPAAREP
jgi:glucan phosphoethanolaminetransferase (alkaline phosphatase superfamily)